MFSSEIHRGCKKRTAAGLRGTRVALSTSGGGPMKSRAAHAAAERPRAGNKARGGETDTVLESPGGLGHVLERFSLAATESAGSSWAFGVAVAVILAWVVTGPVFHFSDTWQLVINTGTTIVTFLMVFLIQRAQNKESKAVQLKLNEIVAAIQGASNR